VAVMLNNKEGAAAAEEDTPQPLLPLSS